MDPITTVREIVELGQRIYKSFVKVSDNIRSAKRLAEDVKEMVEEIEGFCKDHEDVLKNMKDFRLALQGLLVQFQNFETLILPLLPQAGGSRRHRLFRGWEAWRKSEKIERHILELHSDIVKVIRRYIVKGAMRTEVKLEKIHQDTNGGLAGISQGLEAVRRDVSVIRITTAANSRAHSSYEATGSASDDPNRRIITFAQSTLSASLPMLRTPNAITEELMTTAYIKLQINHITAKLDKISKLPAYTPNAVANFHMSAASIQKSMSIMHLRHFVVRQVLDMREHLEKGNTQSVSIRQGADALNTLSIALGALHMGPESIHISKWATRLSHMLVDSSGVEPDLCAALGLHLANQSVQYYNDGDKVSSLRVIKEAHSIALNLRDQFNGAVRFRILYSHILVHYALLVDTQRSINMLVEVVQVLEDIFGLTQSQTPDPLRGVPQSSSSHLDCLFSATIPIIAVSNYALALQRLGTHLFEDGRSDNATSLHLLAIAVRRKIVSTHGHAYNVDLADALSSLVRTKDAKSHIPTEVLLNLTDECIQLFRELAEHNPISYARRLINVLWAKATSLENLGRDTEAIATWEEVVSLAGKIAEDSKLCAAALGNLAEQFRRLKRHDDAVRTMTLAITAYPHDHTVQALRYGILSGNLGQLRNYKESTEAAQASVALHRRAAMSNPGTPMGALTAMLSDLARCMAASDQYSDALIVWEESVIMLDKFLLTNPDVSSMTNNDHLAALRTHVLTSYLLEDEVESLKVSSTAAQYFRKLWEMCCPQSLRVTVDLLWAEFTHAYNLLRVGRLRDAQQYITAWSDLWRSRLEATSNSDMMWWHGIMIALKVNALDAQGRTNEALLANQRVYNIVRPSVGAHHFSFTEMIKSMVRGAQLQMDLGNNEDALKVAEEALQLARNDKLGPSVPTPVRSLHGVASAALICRDYARAVEVAVEGCKICASPSWQDGEREQNILLRPSLLAILSSAEANLGRHSTALSYAKKAVEVSLDIKEIRLHISATTAEQSYMETRGNLAEILLVTGDLAQAREICEERRAYFSKRVDTRMGEYRDLAPILRILAILYCSEGRHEEGEAATQELSRIVNTLGSTFSSLQEQVKIRLRYQSQVRILKVLDDIYQGLDCKHQTGVASLFSI